MRVTPRVTDGYPTAKALLLGALFVWVGSACTQKLDTTRAPGTPRTAGEAVYEEVCNRVSFAADPTDVAGKRARAVCHDFRTPPAGAAPRLQALHGQRARFIKAVDTALAEPGLAGDLKDYLARLMPLYDNGLMGEQLAAGVQTVHSLRDGAPATALAHLAARPAHGASRGDSLLNAALRFPSAHTLLGSFLALVGENASDRQLWPQLQRAMHQRLQTEPNDLLFTDAATFGIARDFLLRPVSHASHQPPQWVVLRDSRGLPLPKSVAGFLPTPLADCNKDGLADADGAGHFIDCQGRPLDVAPPFGDPSEPQRNALGQLLTQHGDAFYQYVDLSQSALHALAQQARQISQTNRNGSHPLLEVASSLDAALQPKMSVNDDQGGAYHVYNPTASPLVDAATAMGWVVAQGGTAELMDIMGQLVSQNEAALASVAHLAWQAADWSAEPNVAHVSLEPRSTLVDDLLDLGAEVASVPDLLKDLLSAVQNPNTQRLGHLMAAHMLNRDPIDFDPDNINGPPLGNFVTPVDRDQPDKRGNISVMQRLVHLVHDAQQPMCNIEGAALSPFVDYARCDMFKVENSAIFYLQAILGQAEFTIYFKPDDDTYIGSLAPDDLPGPFGLAGVRQVRRDDSCVHPESGDPRICVTYNIDPAGAARLLFVPFSDRPVNDPAGQMLLLFNGLTEELQADGERFSQIHGATLFAWEIGDFFDAIRPVLQAFAKHHREDLVVATLDLLHRHYATPANDTVQGADRSRWNYSERSGMVRFEPFVARLIDNQPQAHYATYGNGFAVMGEFTAALGGLSSVGGKKGDALMAGAAGHAMSPGFETASSALLGERTRFIRSDGRPVGHVTAMHVARRALNHLSATSPAHRGASNDNGVMRHLFAVEAAPQGGMRLTNRQVHSLLAPTAGAMQQWLALHHTSPDLPNQWKTTAFDLIRDPLLSSSLQMAAAAGNDEIAAAQITALLHYFTHDHLNALVGAGAELLQSSADVSTLEPLLRASAVAFTPNTGLAGVGVRLLEQSRGLDDRGVLARLLPGLGTPIGPDPTDETPVQVFADIYQQINRLDPASTQPLSVDDFSDDGAVLGRLEGFLLDPHHGLTRLLQLVDSRHGLPDSRKAAP